MEYRLLWNFTEISQHETRAEIMTAALDQSSRFDDVFVIYRRGIPTHMVQYGAVYPLGKPLRRKAA